MAKSFNSLNDMYRASAFKNAGQIVHTLRKTDEAMTFKKLGVISTSEIWRPKTTKLFNFVKLVEPVSESPLVVDNEFLVDSFLSDGYHHLATSIETAHNDPIFNGVNRNVIGITKVKPFRPINRDRV
jgi:hypothetical protein